MLSMRAMAWLDTSVRARSTMRPLVTTDCSILPCVTSATSTGVPRLLKKSAAMAQIPSPAAQNACVRVNFMLRLCRRAGVTSVCCFTDSASAIAVRAWWVPQESVCSKLSVHNYEFRF